MSVLVTGATGFIGRRLLELLIARDEDVYALARPQSVDKLEGLAQRLDAAERVKPVVADLSAPLLGIEPRWIRQHAGDIEHVFHLAAVYDMEASDETNEIANVGGTRETVAVANALNAGCLHHVSSVAAAGSYVGTFTEEMFDVGQPLPHPYHRTKFESERIARQDTRIPWRVYRPAIVVGDSRTGEMDKVDGPYYFFPLLGVASRLPSALRSPAPRLGATNLVPVDFVASAVDFLAHEQGLVGRAFHLVNPKPQLSIEVLNVFARVAGAPRLTGVLPRATFDVPLQLGVVRDLLLPQLGIPAAAIDHVSFTCTFDSVATRRALTGSGIEVPPLEAYAPVLWKFWEEHMRDGRASEA
ncbi:MAG: SDR family oxidoreductase [Solirubrobacteraceae bacterium]